MNSTVDRARPVFSLSSSVGEGRGEKVSVSFGCSFMERIGEGKDVHQLQHFADTCP